MTSRSLRVHVYCPDRHLQYDGRTPDRIGVGGGVTARIRLASTLARLGHVVTVVCNCVRDARIDRVRYVPLEAIREIDTDVLILQTSGGDVDLTPVLTLPVLQRLRVAWLQGFGRPKGLEEVHPDMVVAPSNAVRRAVRDEWGVPETKLFVIYNGAERRLFGRRPWSTERRNPYRLTYTGHPAKGLDAALGVLRYLRQEDARFELHVFGGHRLWGGPDELTVSDAGVTYHGLVAQGRLARALSRSSVALHLQAIPEGFSLAIAEAMAAGCIVVASPVGANVEAIESGRSGFLLAGDHLDPATWRQAATLIHALTEAPAYAEYIRQNAKAMPWTWDRLALVWTQLWTRMLDSSGSMATSTQTPCPECGHAEWLLMADGLHCAHCGLYRTGLDGSTGSDYA